MLLRIFCILFGIWEIAGYTPKICVNCKYYILTGLPSSPQYGKCQKYPRDIGVNANYLVTGVKETPEYRYCSTVRESEQMCGAKGKDYVRIRAKPKTSPKKSNTAKSKPIEPSTNTL
jgi:hypothetical protein